MGGSTTVENGGIVLGNFTLTAVNLDVQTGGSFSANGTGYAGGTTGASGAGTSGGGNGNGAGGGGSHGGLGSAGSNIYTKNQGAGGATTYGSSTQPTTFGSGGGGTGSYTGSNGGGAIRLILSGTLTVNGSLTADGANVVHPTNYYSGAGAGGSLWIAAADISGTGTISAKGGSNTYCNAGSTWLGGGGGGGRIAIYNAAHMFHGTISVSGGNKSCPTDNNVGDSGSFYIDSSIGLCDTGSLATTCTISSDITLPHGWAISGAGNLVVASGVTVRVLNPTDTITIAMSGDVTINGTIAANVSNLSAYNVTIATSGSLNANGWGYSGGAPQVTGSGSGGGIYALNWGGGGSHAGTGGAGGGGAGTGALGGTPYGSASNPTTMGSGGGGSNCGAGGNGGGIVKIVATNALTIDGALASNGANGTTKSGSCNNSGAGAGGTVRISAATLTGTGTISAIGGDAFSASGGGGGGGGRIYINAPNPFRGSNTASIKNAGGSGKFTSTATYQTYDGERGSFYLAQTPCDSGTSATTCTISGYYYLPNSSALTLSGNLVLASGANLFTNALEQASINVTGSVTIQNGGTIKANLSSLTAASLDVQTGGSINANGLGYPGIFQTTGLGTSAGFGNVSAPTSGAGGAYGGNGGYAQSNANQATYFGTATKTQPTSFGSAGGGAVSATGGAGGGAIRINVTGALAVNGSITADGTVGTFASPNPASGGGSGGSLWISAGTISGGGSITAKGGNALAGYSSNAYCSGAGGGGRIAYDTYTSNTFSGSLSAAAGTVPACTYYGTGNGAGGVGSICDKGAGAGCIN